MKIAFTSDLHLKTINETPERFSALEYIFQELKQTGIKHLIIAGDTFNKEANNYNDFNTLCLKYQSVTVTVLPGNHDPDISKKFFTAGNIEVIDKPEIKTFDNFSLLFLPYDPAKTMDEALTEFAHNNALPERWLLTGHGDYCASNRQANPYEPGIYMPLSGAAINKFNPLKVILGHIHKPLESGRIVYPGSPCGLDINETGKRRFIIYYSGDNSFETLPVKTGVIFFNENIITFPVENEIHLIKESIDRMIAGWNLDPNEKSIVRLRLKITGFTRDINKLKNEISGYLDELNIKLYNDEEPDISEAGVIKDTYDERITLLERVRSKIEELHPDFPKEKILDKAMKLIFES